jgi:carboxymethylenebutenolidase
MQRTPRFWLAALLLPLTAGLAGADVKTRDITFKSADEEIKGFLAEPEGKGPFPAVVVIQEWWGLNDWIKENVKRLAGQGYVALAPDLYRGKVTDDRAVAGQLLKGLPRDRALRDLKAAVGVLANRSDVKKDRIGAIGWCMGGGYALQLALNDPRIHAMAMCYGAVVTDPDQLKPLDAAVLGIFGADDKGISANSVREFEAALKKAGKKNEHIEIYSKAGHGFMRPANGPGKPNPEYRETQAKDAWKRIDAFFAKELAGK